MSQISSANSGGGGGSGIIETIAGDTGSITGANVTIYANQASNNSGGTVLFSNSGTTSTLNLSDVGSNTFIGNLSGGSYDVNFNVANTALGTNTLQSLTNGPETTARNIAVGQVSLGSLTGNSLGGGNDNIAIGTPALNALIDGDQNIAIGTDAGNAYTSNESNNILLSHPGIVGESDTIRLGVISGGDPHTRNFQAGISGVTVAASSPVAINSSGQLSDLGFGTSTQVLTSNGAGSSPTWQAAGGGGSSAYFQAYLTSPQTVAGGSVSDTIIFNSAVSNVGSGYNTGTGVFTAPSTGFYGFSTTIFYNNLNGPAGNTQVILGYTGNVQSLRLVQQGVGGYLGGVTIILTASWSMPMTAGDTVQIQPFADGAGNYQIFGAALSSGSFNTSSTFSGFKIA